MRPTIRNHKDGTIKTVENLGWLLRHASEVTTIHIRELDQGRGHLRAYLPGKTYSTEFADYTILSAFVCRRVFQHVKIVRC